MPTLQYLPAWTVNYQYDVRPNTFRSRMMPSTQRRSSHRNIMRASASRQLFGAQLPYFEAFMLNILDDCSIPFTDSYADENGLTTGLMQIVGGYQVQSDTRNHIVTCELEIFR